MRLQHLHVRLVELLVRVVRRVLHHAHRGHQSHHGHRLVRHGRRSHRVLHGLLHGHLDRRRQSHRDHRRGHRNRRVLCAYVSACSCRRIRSNLCPHSSEARQVEVANSNVWCRRDREAYLGVKAIATSVLSFEMGGSSHRSACASQFNAPTIAYRNYIYAPGVCAVLSKFGRGVVGRCDKCPAAQDEVLGARKLSHRSR